MTDEKRPRWLVPLVVGVAVSAVALTLVAQRAGSLAYEAAVKFIREEIAMRSVFAPTVPRSVYRAVRECESVPTVSLLALVHAESKGRPDVVALDGGVGLGQVMPVVARKYNYEPREMLDPDKNIRVTILHFSASMKSWHSNEMNAVAGYNCGVTGWTGQLRAGTTPGPTRGLLDRYKESKRRLTRWIENGEVSPD